MSALRYWLWLSSTHHLGPAVTSALLDEFGSPENVYFAPDEALFAAAEMTEQAKAELRDKSFDRAERILARCEATGVGIITMQDTAYPDRLRNIYAPPAVLYFRGTVPAMDEEAAVAVVGSRSATPYGAHVAREMSFRLARAGVLVVSGMAKGIDGIAHTGALQAGASTVAVLGCGADIIYPAVNKELFEDIIANGAVLTEYPPGTPAIGANFPARNRIISGLSLGVLVIEAPMRSGALITAQYAREQGRGVFAVPGNIDMRESEGGNALIKAGASVVTEVEDILREYAPLFPAKIRMDFTPTPPMPPPEKRRGRASAQEERREVKAFDLTAVLGSRPQIQQKIILAVSGGPKHIDDIIDFAGVSASAVLSELTILEIEKVVRQLPGKYFVLITDE